MVDTPPPDDMGARLKRVQDGITSAREISRLEAEVLRLQAVISSNETRRDRANTTRFIALCLIVLVGLGSLVFLQIDSRGSGQLRGALVQQCTERNENIVATKTSLEQQAKNNENAGQSAYAEVWRTLAQSLSTTDCATLR